MIDVFPGLALILGLSAAAGVVAKSLKQPPLVGYVLAGVVIGLAGWSEKWGTVGLTEVMGKIGVTLLLFLAGMELPLAELKRTGKTALVTALVQIGVCATAGMGLAIALGFLLVEAVYIGLGLALGSTILVVKILSENGDIQSLQGKIAVGYLLVQDFVAIGLLVVLSGAAGGGVAGGDVAGLIFKGLVMVVLAVGLAQTLMGKVADYLAGSTELLFITSIGWCLLVAAAVSLPVVGFSVEIGGFLAGLSLARASEQAQIIARVRPLRDFFLTWFFVGLGAAVKLNTLDQVWLPAVIFSLAVVVLTTAVVYTVLTYLGHHKRTALFTAVSVAQISEFSLIIAAAGVRTGQVGDRVVLVLTLVALITMTTTSYLIANARGIYLVIGRWLWGGQRREPAVREIPREKMAGHVILFGHNRTGSRVRPTLERLGFRVLVVDFNPEVIDRLTRIGVLAMYGDVSDLELYEQLDLPAAKMVISTVPDVYDNLHLLGGISKSKGRPETIVTAADNADAQRLYRAGADFVLIPNRVGGDFLAGLLEQQQAAGTSGRKFLQSRREVMGDKL